MKSDTAQQDVISPEYLEELALLQDRIAPFSTELALQIIEQELGVTVEQLFTEISPQPVAAASLGQVQLQLLSNLNHRFFCWLPEGYCLLCIICCKDNVDLININ